DRMTAALRGGREIGFRILSMTLSLAAGFIPVVFVGGAVGPLLHEIAITIRATGLVSGAVPSTLTPTLPRRLLRTPPARRSRLCDAAERLCDGRLHTYDGTLKWVLRPRVITMATLVLTFIVTGVLFYRIPKGFIPTEDNGSIFAFTETAQDISFDAMVDKQKQVAELIRHDPPVQRNSPFHGTPARAGRPT